MSSTRKGSNPAEAGVEELTFYYEEMVRSNLLELEVETPHGKIILRRMGKDDRGSHPQRRRTDFLSPSAAAEEAAPTSNNTRPVTSPIMGIFYRASSPQSPPLVKEGDVVDGEKTLCIIEAMKVMNEIKSEMRCRIVKIMAENGKPVTKGQVLFNVEPVP